MIVAQLLLAMAWLGLITLGMMPEWGARFGLWLRNDGPAPPPPRRPIEVERPHEVPPTGVDRYV